MGDKICVRYGPDALEESITMEQLKRFAYDSQLSLFPDPVKEEARKHYREIFESGKTPEVVHMKEV